MSVLIHRHNKPVGKGFKLVETIVGTVAPDAKDKPSAIAAAINKAGLFKVGKVEVGENLKVYTSVADVEADIAEKQKVEADKKKVELAKKLARFTEDELKTFAEASGGDLAALKALRASAPKPKPRKTKDKTETAEPAAATA